MRFLQRAWLPVAGGLGAVAVAAAGWLAWPRDGGGSPEEFCAAVADRARYAALVEDFEPSDVLRSLDQLRTARLELERLHPLAPGELRSELDVQRSALDALIEALEAVEPGDSVAAIEAVLAVEDDLQEVPAATWALEQWTVEHCNAR